MKHSVDYCGISSDVEELPAKLLVFHSGFLVESCLSKKHQHVIQPEAFNRDADPALK